MAVDVNEAYKLEELESYIDKKSESLKDYKEEYEFFLRKCYTFVNEYSQKMKAFSEMVNKEIDAMHQMVNTFDGIYQEAEKTLTEKKKELLSLSPEFDGELSKEFEKELSSKLTSESDKMMNNANEILKNYQDEYKKAVELISKISARLNKLKEKNF